MPHTESPPAVVTPCASPVDRLEHWRVRGAQRLDPIGFQLLDALARRCNALTGEARDQLEARLAARMVSFEQRHASSFASAGATGAFRLPTQPRALPHELTGGRADLRTLVIQLREQAARKPEQIDGVVSPSGPDELKALSQFRDTRSRLQAERLLADAQALVPDPAGPLNTERLIHRALQVMHTVAPGYLQHFMQSLETLDCLERAQGGSPRVAGKDSGRTAATPRKPSRPPKAG